MRTPVQFYTMVCTHTCIYVYIHTPDSFKLYSTHGFSLQFSKELNELCYFPLLNFTCYCCFCWLVAMTPCYSIACECGDYNDMFSAVYVNWNYDASPFVKHVHKCWSTFPVLNYNVSIQFFFLFLTVWMELGINSWGYRSDRILAHWTEKQ